MACGLFNLMEDFILREVDYSQQYGYSSRAKRYMRRKLNKELAPFIEDEMQLDKSSDTEIETSTDIDMRNFNKSILMSSRSVDICLSIVYICIIATFYGTTMYMVQTYSMEQNKKC
jgi:hypothetical protein